MKSPKELLLKDTPRLNKFSQITEDPSFEELLHLTYSQFCFGLPKGENPSKDWDANARRDGALEFMKLLTTITTVKKETERSDRNSLQYEPPAK